jgi:hypothetical protein
MKRLTLLLTALALALFAAVQLSAQGTVTCNTETQFTCCECNPYHNCQPSAGDHSLCQCHSSGGDCSGGGDCRQISGHLECVTAVKVGIDALKAYPFLANPDLAKLVYEKSSIPEMERLMMMTQLNLLVSGVRAPLHWELNTTRGRTVKGGRTIEEGATRVSLVLTIDAQKNATIKFYVDESPLLPEPHGLDKYIASGAAPTETLVANGTKWTLHSGDENGAELASNQLKPWKAPLSCKKITAMKEKQLKNQPIVKEPRSLSGS